MASKHSLKRKLGDMGVDLNSRRATENFCLIGTPLQPLEKAKDEFVPLWKQEVRDEKGRKRLHGAFTGGFSAGYFNSVGSKEGWTPSTFVSSRNERAKKKAARPEDFMDEEDLEELRDSRKLVNTNEQMDLTTPSQRVDDNDPISATIKSAFQPLGNDSAGAKILKKMGWRFGQGIGPRVSLKQRKQQDDEAFDPYTGLKHAGQSLEFAEDDDEASKHTYPRRDIPVLHVAKKDNRHGLGYKSGITLNESLGRKTGAAGPQLAAGFGLGALNDAEDDDIDVYDSSTNARNRVAFDHLDQDGEETIAIGARSERGAKPPPQPTTAAQFFPDGTPVVAGFSASNETVKDDTWFAGPDVPQGWKSDPSRVWDIGPNKENLRKPLESAKIGRNGRPELSATERQAILGEAPLPLAPRSVFDFMSAKDKERIQRIAAGLSSSGAPQPAPPKPPVTIPKTDPQSAQAALRGFQPFTSDSAKQARYNAYLHSQATPDSASPLKALPNQSEDEFQKEVDDYAKAAQLFKPISAAMAGRFTSAATVDFGPKVVEGLHQPTQEEFAAKEEEKKLEEEKNVTPKVHAARMGMYGRMTREVAPWMPAALLCKRFGVKQPEMPDLDGEDAEGGGGGDAARKAGGGKAAAQFEPTAYEKEAAAALSVSGPATASGSGSATPAMSSDLPKRLENIGLGEDEAQGADILTYERPSMDIFKAIFASDDEDSDEEPDQAEEKVEEEKEVEKTEAVAVVQQDTGPVDLATFKPTFIPREGKGKAKDEAKKKEKKDKKERRDKKKAAKLSFQVDDEGDDGEPDFRNPTSSRSKEKDKDRPTKKRKDAQPRQEVQDDGMFVDPPASQAKPPLRMASTTGTATTSTPPTEAPSEQQSAKEWAPSIPKGRKRAIDFLDD